MRCRIIAGLACLNLEVIVPFNASICAHTMQIYARHERLALPRHACTTIYYISQPAPLASFFVWFLSDAILVDDLHNHTLEIDGQPSSQLFRAHP